MCLPPCVHVPGTQRGERGHQIPLELELQVVVSCHMGAGNQRQVLCRCRNCWCWLSQLPIALPSFLRLNVWLLIQNSLFSIGIDSDTLSSEYVIKSSLEFVTLWFKVFSSCLHDFFRKSTCCLRVHFVNLPHFLCITCRFNNTALWEHTLYGFWILNFTKPSYGLTSGLLWRCFLWAWLPLPSGGVFLMSPGSGCFRLSHDFTWWSSAWLLPLPLLRHG